MDIRIFDVEHGDCFLILSERGESALIDCGVNTTTNWEPSNGLAKQGFGSRRKLHHLVITHPDQDHLGDLPGVLTTLKPINVWQHPQLNLAGLAELKLVLSKAQDAYLATKKDAAYLQPKEVTRKFTTVQVRQFYLPLGSVRDANDLSLVTFITENNFTVCFPGDLGKRGWRLHLQNPAFQYLLRETNLFIASHHGRASAYYEPVYEYLFPKLIVISDKEQIKGKRVLQRAPYRDHARGVKLEDGSFRRVLTTRGDGRIRVVVKDGKWQVSTSRTTRR